MKQLNDWPPGLIMYLQWLHFCINITYDVVVLRLYQQSFIQKLTQVDYITVDV